MGYSAASQLSTLEEHLEVLVEFLNPKNLLPTCAGTLSMQRKLVSVRKPFPRSGRSAQPHHPKRASKSGGCQGEGAQGGHIHHSLHSATGDPGISMSIHRDRSQLHPKRLPCTASCGKSPQNPATTHPPDLPINDHPMCVM